MAYSDAHRLFLQLMTHKRSLDERDAVKLMEQCCKEYRVKAKNLEGFVLELNLELKHMQLVVRSAMEEREDGDYPCLVLANLMASEATRELGSFTRKELSFMQQLVMEIVSSKKGEVEINTALNIGPRLSQKLMPSICEDLVEHLVEDKWLIKSLDEEYVSLSALCITELAAYLEETYPDDVHKCFFCTKLTIKGYHCNQCNISIHRDCSKKYWADRDSYDCPGEGCNASFRAQVDSALSSQSQAKRRRMGNTDQEDETMDEVETEEEEEEVEEAVAKKGTMKGSLNKSKSREKMDVNNDDDVSEEEEEEEEEEVRKKGGGRSSVKKSMSREVMDVSDDNATEEEEEEEEEVVEVMGRKERRKSPVRSSRRRQK